MPENSIDWFIPLWAYLGDRVVVAANPASGYHHEFQDLAESERYWAKIMALSAPESKDELWGNGKHFGDCTNQPITCNTCLVDSTRREARYVFEFVSKLVNEGYPEEVRQCQ